MVAVESPARRVSSIAESALLVATASRCGREIRGPLAFEDCAAARSWQAAASVDSIIGSVEQVGRWQSPKEPDLSVNALLVTTAVRESSEIEVRGSATKLGNGSGCGGAEARKDELWPDE